MTADSDPGERQQRISAEKLLRSVLATEWVPWTEIEPLMHAAGISKATLWRAKSRLGVQDTRIGFGKGGRSEWGPPVGGWKAEGGGGKG